MAVLYPLARRVCEQCAEGVDGLLDLAGDRDGPRRREQSQARTVPESQDQVRSSAAIAAQRHDGAGHSE
jgi:hypothetical protein